MWIIRKDRSELTAECRLYVDESPPRRHYFSVYLWNSSADLEEATPGDALPVPAGLDRDGSGDVLGKCCHSPQVIRMHEDRTKTRATRPKLGEIHLVHGKWNMEIVSHECLHAALGVGRHLGDEEINDDQAGEEQLCYRLGSMVDGLYRWLWESEGSDVTRWHLRESKLKP